MNSTALWKERFRYFLQEVRTYSTGVSGMNEKLERYAVISSRIVFPLIVTVPFFGSIKPIIC
ncbi:hypothetical protein, partial [Bacillus paranthracis]|uniref:hypothetical protein n=1 Tax=Bacillus paranthracis TaxID=2026186 RepID=UPI0024061783